MARKLPNHVFWMLAPLFALVGAGGGALGAHSLWKYQSAKAAAEQEAAFTPQPSTPGNRANSHAANRPEAEPGPEPTPEPDPTPTPNPPKPLPTLMFHSAAGAVVSARPVGGREFLPIADGAEVAAGSRVQVSQGSARFVTASFTVWAAAPVAFSWTDDRVLRLTSGRIAVRATGPCSVESGEAKVHVAAAAYVLETSGLQLTEGGATLVLGADRRELVAPARAVFEAGLTAGALDGDALRGAERETLGPVEVLLEWDCESPQRSPAVARLVSPGAYGSTAAASPVSMSRGVGAGPADGAFSGVEGARLRMRVLTDASEVLVEMRLAADDGFRVVELRASVPRRGAWCWIDVALEDLRGGTTRNEPGWLHGRQYRGLRMVAQSRSPLPDPGEFQLDDLLIYAPR
ncbi:MAG: hypothetical protein IT464_13325 [Planctomycetes bacterium]|nr:hypothetical protein [Planctomycetota bacterium]